MQSAGVIQLQWGGNMSIVNVRKHFSVFFLGVFAMGTILLLSGAKEVETAAKSNETTVGRYQMEIVVRDRITQIYVMDTTSGVVKWVDAMNTPFGQLKGD